MTGLLDEFMNNGAHFQISLFRFIVDSGALLTQPDTAQGLPNLETENAKPRLGTATHDILTGELTKKAEGVLH